MSGIGSIGSLPGMAPDMAAVQMRRSAGATATAAAATRGGANMAQVRKAATEFEAVFATEMVSHMFQGIGADKMFGGGNGEDVFRSLLVEQYGHAIARTGSLGIADKVAAEMIKSQEH